MAKTNERTLCTGLCLLIVFCLVLFTSNSTSSFHYRKLGLNQTLSDFSNTTGSVVKAGPSYELGDSGPKYSKIQRNLKMPSSLLPENESTQSDDNSIPNIVHYVWLVLDREEITFGIKEFISMYSAHLYWKPDTIYLHTDASPELVKYAKYHGNQWTRHILQLSNVQINAINVPTHTRFGLAIESIEAKSDFIRTAVLVEFGGIYIDTDVIPIRSITPLLQSGFSNVVGLQISEGGYGRVGWHAVPYNQINNGIVLAEKGSTLMRIFQDWQHEAYNGDWAVHSVVLLTDLCYALAPMAREVLILPKHAFSPSSWLKSDLSLLFEPHNDATTLRVADEAALPPVPTNFIEARAYWAAIRAGNRIQEDWEVDYSGAYMIHAFDNEKIWHDTVTLDYVLSRKSNYARVVYPAVLHAIENGLIEVEAEVQIAVFKEMEDAARVYE